MKFDSLLEEYFYNRFTKLNLKFITSKKVYDIKLTRPLKRNVPYDFSIVIGNITIAIIELKGHHFIDIYDYSNIEKYAAQNNIKFVILSDGEKFIITDRKNPNTRGTFSFDEFIDLLSIREEIDVTNLKNEVSQKIKSIIQNSDFRFLKEQINELSNQISHEIDFNEIDQSFSFRNPTDINNIENKIFRLLLKEDKPLTKIYRYTTLNTVYSMLINNSFRMNCLVGMNDTTEVNYAENYITGTNRDYTQAQWQTVDAYNRRFISSCSLKEDDLTQWRLYAEDSKGVCLVLNVDQKLLNTKFILKRISYGEKDGKHPELDFIRQIIANLKDELNIDFEFKTLTTWRHFFKPFDYAVEAEVRLLFVLQDDEVKKGWLLTSSHSILNPYVDFKLNDDGLPIHLTEIVLGPKCPEKEINQKQFEQIIRELKRKKKKIKVDDIEQEVDEYKIAKMNVSISKIKNYR
jgi:hypothetical protein